MADIAEWLGGKFGRDGAKELRAEMVQNFTIGAAAKVWALDDVPPPEKEGTLDGAEMARCIKFVSTILVDCHKARGSTDPPSAVEFARLEDWLTGRYSFVDVTMATASKAAAAATSAECQADLAAQGMTDLNTLLFVELSKELGRPVGASETEGGAYRSPPTIMKGATAAKKAAPAGSFRTYTSVIQSAKESGDLRELEEWIMRLAMKLQSHSHPYAATYAMRSQARWQNARMKLRHPLAIIKYYAEAHVEEMGRGEPFGAELDAALSISALSEGMMAMATRPQPLGSFSVPSSPGTMSSLDGSTLGGSASQTGSTTSSQLSAMSSQLGEVIAGLKSLSDDGASLRKRMAKLEEDHNNIGKCHLCGRKGHKKEDCPDKDKPVK